MGSKGLMWLGRLGRGGRGEKEAHLRRKGKDRGLSPGGGKRLDGKSLIASSRAPLEGAKVSGAGEKKEAYREREGGKDSLLSFPNA